jgi:murein DD-endopeptidase MepM/ murein hydrolase activator NlpD
MGRLKVPVALAVLVAASVFALEGRWPWRRLQVASPIVVSSAFTERSDTLRSGETLQQLFLRQGLLSFDISRLFGEGGLDPRRLRAGLVFSFRRVVGDSEPSQVAVRTSADQRVHLERGADGWDVERRDIRWSTDEVPLGGRIDNSLYAALDAAVAGEVLGAEERMKLAWDLADVFAWNVDFTRDIQPGDGFSVVVERRVSEEGEHRYGRVLAAELTVSGKTLTAYRFEQDGKSGYYDAAGNSLRRAFLRAPVQFRRISSTFSRARFHPVLRIYRRHAGTDYAADPGTPVLAAGDGAVVRAGWSGGYGNLVEIRHRNGVTTRYAHLRGFAKGVRGGTRVSQGDVIGYVGSTGLSSGPHLHYEFLVNGRQQDPRALRDADGPPIPGQDRAAFEQVRSRYAGMLATASASSVRLGD